MARGRVLAEGRGVNGSVARVELMHMLRKGQVKRSDGRDAAGQAKFVETLFGVAA
jgi:hypothetical protein